VGFARRRAALVVVIAGVLASIGCAEESGPRQPANFGFVLKDMTGRDVKLADFKGKPLVVNFWATWCGPCQLETPQLEAMSRKYRAQGLTILGISTEDAPEDIRRFAADFKVSYPLLVGVDRTDVQEAFNWTGILPTSVFIRADGTIAGRLVGPETDAYWDRRIRALF
jgi:thiol-disulfide isomerase/thioredoxin